MDHGDDRAVGHAALRPHALGRLDRAVGLEAARICLDPVLDHGRLAVGPVEQVGRPARAERLLEAGHDLGAGAGACGRELRGGRPGRRRLPNLERLAVRAERPLEAARAQESEAHGRLGGLAVELEQPRRGHGRAGYPADGRGVPAALADRRVVGGAEPARRLEPGGVRRERLADAGLALRAKEQCDRGRGSAEVGEAGQVGVVEVEHVARGPGRRDPLGKPAVKAARRARRGLLRPADRARQPVEHGDAVGRVEHGGAHAATGRQYERSRRSALPLVICSAASAP